MPLLIVSDVESIFIVKIVNSPEPVRFRLTMLLSSSVPIVLCTLEPPTRLLMVTWAVPTKLESSSVIWPTVMPKGTFEDEPRFTVALSFAPAVSAVCSVMMSLLTPPASTLRDEPVAALVKVTLPPAPCTSNAS